LIESLIKSNQESAARYKELQHNMTATAFNTLLIAHNTTPEASEGAKPPAYEAQRVVQSPSLSLTDYTVTSKAPGLAVTTSRSVKLEEVNVPTVNCLCGNHQKSGQDEQDFQHLTPKDLAVCEKQLSKLIEQITHTQKMLGRLSLPNTSSCSETWQHYNEAKVSLERILLGQNEAYAEKQAPVDTQVILETASSIPPQAPLGNTEASVLKNEAVETPKVTLSPNLIPDDGPSKLVDSSRQSSRRRKEKKQGIFGGLFGGKPRKISRSATEEAIEYRQSINSKTRESEESLISSEIAALRLAHKRLEKEDPLSSENTNLGGAILSKPIQPGAEDTASTSEARVAELVKNERSMFAVHVASPAASKLDQENRAESKAEERSKTLAERAKYQFEIDSDDEAMEDEIDNNVAMLSGATSRLSGAPSQLSGAPSRPSGAPSRLSGANSRLSSATSPLSRLASAMGKEVESQNRMIDRISGKVCPEIHKECALLTGYSLTEWTTQYFFTPALAEMLLTTYYEIGQQLPYQKNRTSLSFVNGWTEFVRCDDSV
jgi:hypothetical protein